MAGGTTILGGIVGSTAYGLATENSDIDRLGLYVAPTRKFHGLHPPVDKAATRVRKVPSDHTEHEARKYLLLLLGANPTVTELLWLPDELYETRTPDGQDLIDIRMSFLSGRYVRNAYLGYATQQFKRLRDRGDGSFSADTRKRTEKHARHLKRLCWQGFQLYATGHLPIRVEDPESYHEFGRTVAADPINAQSLIIQYEELFDTHKSVLQDDPDEIPAERWLLNVRDKYYDSGYEAPAV